MNLMSTIMDYSYQTPCHHFHPTIQHPASDTPKVITSVSKAHPLIQDLHGITMSQVVFKETAGR